MDKIILKNIGSDKIFKIELDIAKDQIRIGLKEVNVYTPYYYEKYYSLEELKIKNSGFNSCNTLEDVKGHLITLFKSEKTYLENKDNFEKIKICFEMYIISGPVKENFILKRETIKEKDDALLALFDIQIKNIEAFRKIENICKEEKYKGDKVAQNILKLLKN